MTVAEDQARQSSGDIPEDEFVLHPSAAAEALALRVKDDKSASRLHPMFRRTSTDTSAHTRGADKPDGDVRPRRTARPTRKDSGVKEEPIEVLSSEEDEDTKPAAGQNTTSRQKQWATTSSHRPRACHQDSDLTSLDEADEAAAEGKPGSDQLETGNAPSERCVIS